MRRIVCIPVVSVLAVAAAFLPAGAAVAGSTPEPPVATCGETISASFTLHNNLTNCSGDGLDVAASNITINLNGHKIYGTNTSTYGVNIGTYSGVTLEHGTISGFSVGVYASDEDSDNNVSSTYGNDETITKITTTYDGNGIVFLGGNGSTVTNSRASHDDEQGIAEYSSTNTQFTDDLADNDFQGFDLEGDGTSATGSNTLTGSTANYNSTDGIYVLRELSDTITGDTANHDYYGDYLQQLDSTSTVSNDIADYDHYGVETDGSGYSAANDVAGAGPGGVAITDSSAENDNYGFYAFDSYDTYGDVLNTDTATANTHAGIYVTDESSAQVENNTTSTSSKSGDGIFVDQYSSDTQISGNTSSSNVNDGIYDADSTSTLTNNTADNNGDVGIYAASGATDGGGNTASGNGSGTQCVNLTC